MSVSRDTEYSNTETDPSGSIIRYLKFAETTGFTFSRRQRGKLCLLYPLSNQDENVRLACVYSSLMFIS